MAIPTTGNPLYWLWEAISAMFGDLMAEPVKMAVRKWLETTAEKVGPHTADYISMKLFGIKSEDERRFNLALTNLDPNEQSMLLARLGTLQSHQSDYYRITVMRDDPAETVAILRSHAQMTDADWANLVVVMNYNLNLDQTRLARFGRWIATQWVATNTVLNTATAWVDPINTRLEQRLNIRQGRFGTVRTFLRSFFTGLQ